MRKIYLLFTVMMAFMLSVQSVNAAQPLPKTDGSVYYYVAFTRIGSNNQRGVLEDQGNGADLKTGALTPGKAAQLWKITGGTNGSLVFISKLGNEIVFNGKFQTSSTAGSGIFLSISETTKPGSGSGTVYQIYKGTASNGNYLNPDGGSGIGKVIGGWNPNDEGNALTFISEKALPAVSPVDHSADVWYYMYYPRDGRGYVKDNGVGVNLTPTQNNVENANDYLWRVISTEDNTGRFFVESKNGRRISYSGKYQTQLPGDTDRRFHFTGCSDDSEATAHFPILNDGNTMMNAETDKLGQYGWYNDAGQAIVFAPVNTYPKISNGNHKYYYQIGFSNRTDGKVIQDNGDETALSQVEKDAVDGQYWLLNGANKSSFKVESKLGNQFSNNSDKTAAVGNNYSLAKSGHASIANQGNNKGEGKIRWQLHREGTSGTTYGVNSTGGLTSATVGEWSDGDQGNSLNFAPVPSVAVIADVFPTTIDCGSTALNISALAQTITVEGFGLANDITYIVSGNDDELFKVTPVDGWNTKEGGTLEVVFTPTATGPFSTTLTITSTDAVIAPQTITLIGTGVSDPVLSTATSLAFPDAVKGKHDLLPKILTVVGANLTPGTVTYALGGTGAAAFSINKTSTDIEEGSIEESLEVTFTAPETPGDYTATLTIAGGDATSIIVNLSGKSIAELAFVSTEAAPTWYFLQTVAGDPWNDFVTDETTSIHTKPYSGLTDAIQWQIVATPISHQYLLKSKAGKFLGYDDTDFVSVEVVAAKTFDFETSSNNWKIKYNEGSNYVNKNANANNSLLKASATGSDFAFVTPSTAVDKLPEFSTTGKEYWYQIRNYDATPKVWNNNAGEVTKVLPPSTATATYWKFVESTNGYKIINYNGDELRGSTKEFSDVVTAGSGHEYNFEWRELNGAKTGTLQRWTLRNVSWSRSGSGSTAQRYLCDGSAQWTYGAGDDNGRTFDFVSVELPTNIATADAASVKVYTNAATLYVETPTAQNVKIYSIAGALIYSKTIEGKTSIALAKGVYVVKTATATLKVVL